MYNVGKSKVTEYVSDKNYVTRDGYLLLIYILYINYANRILGNQINPHRTHFYLNLIIFLSI